MATFKCSECGEVFEEEDGQDEIAVKEFQELFHTAVDPRNNPDVEIVCDECYSRIMGMVEDIEADYTKKAIDDLLTRFHTETVQ